MCERTVPARYCRYCCNACVDESITDESDLSYLSIGISSDSNVRAFFRSGARKRCRIEVSVRNTGSRTESEWIYQPRYCPNCGRYLENDYLEG